jgi:sigma-B regulation protein RsbU (phosphoserine phosphatase)
MAVTVQQYCEESSMASYVLTILNAFGERIAAIDATYRVHSLILEPDNAQVVAKVADADPLVSVSLYTALRTKVGQLNWGVDQLSSPIDLEDPPAHNTQYFVLRTLRHACMGVVAVGYPGVCDPAVAGEVEWLAAKVLPVVLRRQLEDQSQGKPESSDYVVMSVLHEISYELGQSLTHSQAVSIMFEALNKVLDMDLFCVFLLGVPSNAASKLVFYLNSPADNQLVEHVRDEVLKHSLAFLGRIVDARSANIIRQIGYNVSEELSTIKQLNSVVNVPLIFRGQFMGLVYLGTHRHQAYTQSDYTFLHTISNQISTHLWRMKFIRASEKTKISSMIGSMTEGMIMLDEHHEIDIVNRAAKQFLQISTDVSSNAILDKLSDLGIMDLLVQSIIEQKAFTDIELNANELVLSANIAPVCGVDKRPIGTVIVLRNITKVAHIQRVNEQRLSIIEQVTKILNSITDLDRLLSVLLQLLLSIGHADMGCIQLKQGTAFVTRVHENFPDKIRRQYRFVSGQTLSQHVVEMQTLLAIKNYHSDALLNQKTKVLVDSYVCIPIKLQDKLIGILHVVQKSKPESKPLIQGDIDTLSTITALSAAAIQNAQLIEDTLSNQKLDQEIQVAFSIQKQLLPAKVPESPRIQFGAMFKPAAVIGGDYYDFFELGNGCVGIMIADIIGKGVPAALYMVMFKTLVQINIHHDMQPSQLFERLNNIMVKESLFSRFIPVFYGVLNTETCEFWYSNAGHEPPIWFTQEKEYMLKAKDPPLGMDADIVYNEKKIQLKPDDIVCFFTDGLVDARSSDNRSYGYRRLKKLVRHYDHLTGQALINRIYDHVSSFSTGRAQHDDLTIVLISCKSSHTKTEMKLTKSKTFSVQTHKKSISEARHHIAQFLKSLPFSKSSQFDIKLAVNEAQANVLEHVYGGKEDEKIYFTLQYYPNRLVIIMKDTKKKNASFLNSVQTSPLIHLEGSGLGVFLIKQLMDEVSFLQTDLGGVLTMTKFIVE